MLVGTVISYLMMNIYLSFDKDDTLDPEFPLTTEGCCLPDDYYCDRPEHVLMRMCNGLTPTTVNKCFRECGEVMDDGVYLCTKWK